MKAAQLSGLIFVVFTIHSAHSILCFQCVSPPDSNCIMIEDESLKYLELCGNADDPTVKFKCLETLIEEEHKYTMSRNCISTERLNYCDQLKTAPKLNTLICKICDDQDGCNNEEYFFNGSKNNKQNAYFLINASLIYSLYTTMWKK
uniref:Putative secreted protein n=1 Tax=Panstrongylus lignarius TaxID=156445 RepID=A0A224XZD3_9HEMI